MDDVARKLASQDGVISRRQALAAELAPHDIARKLRRREWATVHDGVYLDHTGEPPWAQRAWAAVLFCWPAALSHDSAVRAAEGPGRRGRDESVIHVAVERVRHVTAPRGVRVHRVTGFAGHAQWNLGPPRIRYEHAVLDLASEAADDRAAVAVLANACAGLRTTASRLSKALEQRTRLARRARLVQVLEDVADGTCSVLEHEYLVKVERAHGLPDGIRQASHRHRGLTTYRDVDYDEWGLVVELDGRLFHDSAEARERDMERDLDAAVDGAQTLRLSYGMVFGRACDTAGQVARVLQRRGWTGTPTSCPDCGGTDLPGESDPPQSLSA